jgi:hypothetical protein
MNRNHPTRYRPAFIAWTAAALAFGSLPALAQEPHEPHEHFGPGHEMHPGLVLDQRYHHDHYYPGRGSVVEVLPSAAVGVTFGRDRYYFHGGVWFRPYGPRFIVTEPPIGIVVPVLPLSYATVWIGGSPYYYADGTYYAVAPGQGYQVVAPPPGADAAVPAPPVAVAAAPVPAPAPARPDPVIYPRNGQSPQQTEADRQECNRWATTQPAAVADAGVFQRAVEACMDAHGYTMR